MRQTTWVGLACAMLLGGLVISCFYSFSARTIVIAVILVLGMKARYRLGFLVCAAFLCLGWWRGDPYLAQLQRYQKYEFAKVTVTAVATDDGTYTSKQQLTFSAKHVSIEGRSLPGTVAISGFGVNSIAVGDTVRSYGKLYPASGSYQARMSYAQLSVIAHHDTPLDAIRSRFEAGVYSTLPEPSASFALGLLIGQRSNLPLEVKQDLLWIGLTHIIAVSGYNLTILLRASSRILERQPRRTSLMTAFALIILFTLLTGASASILRAALVSGFGIIAAYYGRTIKPLNIILIAAAITAMLKPTYVWGDISWYLSFLAFFGVLVVAPLIATRFQKLQRSVVANIMLESLCAEIMTAPIILLTFSQFSTIALLANMTIALLVPVAMLFSAIAGLTGIIAPLWAGWLSWPATLILSTMLEMAHIFATVPHAFLQDIAISMTETIALYLLIVGACVVLYFKNRTLNAKITDRI